MSGQVRSLATIHEVLTECRRRYIRLRIRDGHIAVIGHRLMTPALWVAIRTHEPELIEHIERKRAATVARVFEFQLNDGPRRFLIGGPIALSDAECQLRDRFGDALKSVRVNYRRLKKVTSPRRIAAHR